jgi:tRNA A-37 threonylcarbamoyl transferase component Bud32/TolB-like protein
MARLIDRLRTVLGETYHIERELGGGGMGRLFLADEKGLDREVVIKVLPPDMAAQIKVDRFEQEIRLAAKLQHPHIVPVLRAGLRDGLLFYAMPYVDGESLKARLQRETMLPISDVMRAVRDVADALAYAHKHGVVHRDIKPGNVLFSSGHALVTDFGIAKAVTASAENTEVTGVGVAIGTPAYMAPEQAAADPSIDHRVDIYALGAMAYEALAGRPPFAGNTTQRVLAAHVTREPEPITQCRRTIPAEFGELVMRCLAKEPEDRWQTAEELRAQLDSEVTLSGTAPVVVAGHPVLERPVSNIKVAVLFLLASVGVLAIVNTLVRLIGLPGWVVHAAAALLVIGLPIMLLTGHHEQRRASAPGDGRAAVPHRSIRRHFTWRKAFLGGGLAFAGLTVVVTAYMVLRAQGVGPFGTLVGAGVLDPRERVILADFENRAEDSLLAVVVTEAFRIDIAQSPVVTVVGKDHVAELLTLMEIERGTPLDLRLAREVARRDGLRAVITGEVGALGTGFVVTARIVAVESGEVLVGLRETARTEDDIVAAVDQLSNRLRERIGESFKTLRQPAPMPN